jgi:hypothetical protein
MANVLQDTSAADTAPMASLPYSARHLPMRIIRSGRCMPRCGGKGELTLQQENQKSKIRKSKS